MALQAGCQITYNTRSHLKITYSSFKKIDH